MVKFFGFVLGLLLFAPASFAESSPTPALKDPAASPPSAPSRPPIDKTTLSYSIGASIGKNLRKEHADVDQDQLILGFKNALAGEKLAFPDKLLRQVLSRYQSDLRQRMMAEKKDAMSLNKKAGEEFLALNKSKPGVLLLPSGVQYKVLQPGSGPRPLDSDSIEVYYRGTLLDGSEFDATEPGHPATLKIASLIPGWREALKSMPSGSTWQLVIPAAQAYGERGVGSDIGPNETLIFEVSLLSIK
jgi:FKBP-type peptidyl-prolyl cis-trans isomerase FklB